MKGTTKRGSYVSLTSLRLFSCTSASLPTNRSTSSLISIKLHSCQALWVWVGTAEGWGRGRWVSGRTPSWNICIHCLLSSPSSICLPLPLPPLTFHLLEGLHGLPLLPPLLGRGLFSLSRPPRAEGSSHSQDPLSQMQFFSLVLLVAQ